MELFLLYLWTRLDVLILIGIVLLGASLTGCIVSITMPNESPYSYYTEEMQQKILETNKKGKKYLTLSLKCVVILLLFLAIIPTKKDAAIIAGGWLVKEATQSEVAKQMGERTYKLIVGKLDEQLNELEKKTK